MTPAERAKAFANAQRQQLRRLPRIQRDVVAEIERQLQAAAADVARRLAAAGDTWQRSRLQALQREIAAALAAWQGQAAGVATAGLARAWTAGAELLSLPLEAAQVSFAPRVNLAALRALQSAVTDRIADISTRSVDRINSAIAQVLIGTTPAAKAISQVSEILGGAARRRARTIVVDELGRAYARSTQDAMSQATTLLPGLKKRWLGSGKRHPRPEHAAAHGQIVPVNDPFVVAGEALMYPRDPNASTGNTINCGCFSVPVTDGSTWGASRMQLDPFDARTEPVPVPGAGRPIPLPG